MVCPIIREMLAFASLHLMEAVWGSQHMDMSRSRGNHSRFVDPQTNHPVAKYRSPTASASRAWSDAQIDPVAPATFTPETNAYST